MHSSRCLRWLFGFTFFGLAMPIVGQGLPATQKSVRIFADDYVRIPIPNAWTVVPERSLENLGRKLVLQRADYKLSIRYHTEHASGVIGGRFIEAFTIPWLDTDQAWGCSAKLESMPQPANRSLMFISLYFRTDDVETRNECGIKSNLIVHNGTESYGEQRWFGGYFSPDGGWFFESNGANCGEHGENEDKSYTLVSTARTAQDLPARGDPRLKNVVRQAIAIINSIHYKQCSPTTDPYDPLSLPWTHPRR